MRQYSYVIEPCAPYLIQSECMEISHAGDSKGKEKICKLAIILSDFDVDVWDCTASNAKKPTSLCDHHLISEGSFDSDDSYDRNDGNSDFFRQNYEAIMRGELADWILCGIGLWYDRIKFQYCDCNIGNAIDRKKNGGTIYIRQTRLLVKDIKFTARVPLSNNAYEEYGLWWAAADWKFRDGLSGNGFDILETSATGERCSLEYIYNEDSQKYSCIIHQGEHIIYD